MLTRTNLRRAAVRTTAIVVALASVANTAELGPPFVGPYRLESKPGRRVTAVLEGTVETPDVMVTDWVFVVPVAPDHGWQKISAQSMTLLDAPSKEITVSEAGEDLAGRALQRLRYSVRKGTRSEVRYEWSLDLSLMDVRLVPGEAQEPPAPLGRKERKRWTAPIGRYDFKQKAYRKFAKEHGLTRKKGERDLDFAWRALDLIGQQFEYAYPPRLPERHACDVIEEGASDCGGLSVLFASIMRANKIPARVPVGRWGIADRDAERQFHVRGESYADGVGWVPIDGSGAVSWKGGVKAAFGKNAANFVVMHLDPDLTIDTGLFGDQSVTWMQSPAYWVRGSGSLDSRRHSSVWKVRNRPEDD